MKRFLYRLALLAAGALPLCAPAQQAQYDLLLRGGRVLDAKNNVDAVRDVAIKDGKIAAVSDHIDPSSAVKTVDVHGLLVTPGLVDIHVHASPVLA